GVCKRLSVVFCWEGYALPRLFGQDGSGESERKHFANRWHFNQSAIFDYMDHDAVYLRRCPSDIVNNFAFGGWRGSYVRSFNHDVVARQESGALSDSLYQNGQRA